MRARLLLPATLALTASLLACSDDASSTEEPSPAAGAAGESGASGQGGAGGAAGVEPLERHVSGSRLQVRTVGSEEAQTMLGIWDTTAQTYCEPRKDRSGQLRCLPRDSFRPVFRDAACQEPAGIEVSFDPVPVGKLVSVPLSAAGDPAEPCGADVPHGVYKVGAPLAPDVQYYGLAIVNNETTISCQPTFAGPGAGQEITPVEIGDFVPQQTVAHPIGTRLRRVELHGDDGSIASTSTLLDEQQPGREVGPRTIAVKSGVDRVAYTLPLHEVYDEFSAFLNDGTCQTPVVHIYDACWDGPITLREQGEACGDWETARAFAKGATGTISSANPPCLGQVMEPGDTYAQIGPELSLKDWVQGTRIGLGSSRVVVQAWKNDDGSRVSVYSQSPDEGFVDTVYQIPCVPTETAAGVRCLPRPDRVYFADPGCQTEVLAPDCGATDQKLVSVQRPPFGPGDMDFYERGESLGQIALYAGGPGEFETCAEVRTAAAFALGKKLDLTGKDFAAMVTSF